MNAKYSRRVIMISTHGYVAAEPELGKPDTGGQVVYVLELSKALAERGFEVEILTRQFEDQSAFEQVAKNVELRRFPCGGKDFIPKEFLVEHLGEWVENAVRHYRSSGQRFGTINSHYWDAGVAGMQLANQLNLDHIHTPHSLGAWKRMSMEDPGDEKKLNYDERIRQEKQIYSTVDLVLATSHEQTRHVSELYGVPESRIRQLPPGFCEERFSNIGSGSPRVLKRRFRMERPTVMALGRIARNKGYDLLVRAMPAVVRRVPDAQLVLAIGSAHPTKEELGEVEKLRRLSVDLGIADHVDLRGYVSDEDLRDFYRAADVFVLSSSYEPFGMTAVEAMACGTPTVITTRGGLSEDLQWGVHSLYVDPYDSEGLGYCISVTLMEDDLAESISSNALQLAHDKYRWSAIAREFEADILSLAGTRPRRVPTNRDRRPNQIHV